MFLSVEVIVCLLVETTKTVFLRMSMVDACARDCIYVSEDMSTR